MCGEHEWEGGECQHGPLTQLEADRRILAKDSNPAKELTEVLFCPNWLKSLQFYVFFGKQNTRILKIHVVFFIAKLNLLNKVQLLARARTSSLPMNNGMPKAKQNGSRKICSICPKLNLWQPNFPAPYQKQNLWQPNPPPLTSSPSNSYNLYP